MIRSVAHNPDLEEGTAQILADFEPETVAGEEISRALLSAVGSHAPVVVPKIRSSWHAYDPHAQWARVRLTAQS